MEEKKPESVKTTGLLIAIFSGLIIFGNGMGALVWSELGMEGGPSNQPDEKFNPLLFLISNYIELCLMMVLFGIAMLIGGLFIRKYKLWANRLLTGLSIFLLLIIWGLMIALSIFIGQEEGMEMIKYGAIINATFWSVPVGFLIWFLNKENIRKHFE